jgi:hypothetical protein
VTSKANLTAQIALLQTPFDPGKFKKKAQIALLQTPFDPGEYKTGCSCKYACLFQFVL